MWNVLVTKNSNIPLSIRWVVQTMEALVVLNNYADGDSTCNIRQQIVKETKVNRYQALLSATIRDLAVIIFALVFISIMTRGTHLWGTGKVQPSFGEWKDQTHRFNCTVSSSANPTAKVHQTWEGWGEGGECTTPLSDFHLLRFTFWNLHFIFHPAGRETFHINCVVAFCHPPSVLVLLFVLHFLRRILGDITLVIWLGRRAFIWAGIITWSGFIPRWQLGVQEMQGVPIKTQWQKCLWRETC